MRGRLDVREIEDIGDAALSYNEVKALATGNSLLMDKAEADAELTRLQRACHRNQDALRYKITSTGRRIEKLNALVGEVDAAIARRVDTRGDAFAMMIGGSRYDKRHEAGERLKQRLQRQLVMLGDTDRRGPVADRHGQLGGFDVISTGRKVLAATEIAVGLEGVPESTNRVGSSELNDIDPAKLIVWLENRLHGLEALQAKTRSEIERLELETSRAREDLAKPFSLSQQLIEAKDRVAEIEQQLEDAARNSQRNCQQCMGCPPIRWSDQGRLHTSRNRHQECWSR